MRMLHWVVAAALAVGACTVNPVPQGYTGPTARIVDSAWPHGASRADIFYLAKVNGQPIDESLTATAIANRGRGFYQKPVAIGRDVPASEANFTVVGRTRYAAPIIELTHTVYQVSGEIKFTPLADHSYVVKGMLKPDYSAVWIEDSATGELAGPKIEVKGSAAIGFFEK
jgi:hypothetical protein